MDRPLTPRINWTYSLLVLTVLMVGCKKQPDIDTSTSNPMFSRLGGIAEIYMKYKNVQGGEPDKAQLLAFGDERGGYTLDRLKVTSTEELLVSKRDGQPVVLLLKNSPLSHDSYRIIAHEATGVDGSRMVALDNGGAQLLTEEEFQAAKK